jgi:DNA polymerase III subunit epsilon
MFASLRTLWQGAPASGARWVVLDAESSGLNPARDRLLAIAAVAVHVKVEANGTRLHIVPADSFEAVLQQPELAAAPDKANILVHGLGVGRQRAGVAPALALQAFSAFVAGAPLIGYHVAFDRQLLQAAERAHGLRAPRRRWLDLAELAPVLRRDVPGKALDHWLAAFGIQCLGRHQAAADALATAELLLCLWPLAQRPHGPPPGFRELQRLAEARRWLGA